MSEIAPSELLAATRLPARSFYARPTVDVARSLLGTILLHRTNEGLVAGVIVEVEAYLGHDDPAAHSSAGRTARTRVIFGDAGHAYVYKIYGLHCCLNVVAEPEGTPGCVLIRALEPVCGIDAMRSRRAAARRADQIASGPAKLTQAMGIGMEAYGADLLGEPLSIRLPHKEAEVEVGTAKRIGIRKAQELDLRFFIVDNEHVSRQ
ncbi:MAG: DNA-3-methyladenine glycosylase [Acidobacteriia bacterium]|nr:DNA-3-methyladenine glycosylase [Terriglobia bacterium]MYG02098.1 DNA-3-methyladenine glycosylase [Terriglobia bacterium]MYK08179.1 DNA-3-methyladenine glycosylase [Terriglobia bacterium]